MFLYNFKLIGLLIKNIISDVKEFDILLYLFIGKFLYYLTPQLTAFDIIFNPCRTEVSTCGVQGKQRLTMCQNFDRISEHQRISLVAESFSHVMFNKIFQTDSIFYNNV